MSEGYTQDQRRELARLLAAGGPLRCPVCDATVARRALPPARRVSYVRRRILLICSGCRRAAAVDAPENTES